MAEISREAVVGYSCEQMFALVSDIGAYADFLPWCERSVVDSDDGERVCATLHIKHKSVGMSLTTLNHSLPPHAIKVALVKGPFRHFEGRWSFVSLDRGGCRVGLMLDFDFSNRVYASLFKSVFHRASSSLVDVFVRRAQEVYG